LLAGLLLWVGLTAPVAAQFRGGSGVDKDGPVPINPVPPIDLPRPQPPIFPPGCGYPPWCRQPRWGGYPSFGFPSYGYVYGYNSPWYGSNFNYSYGLPYGSGYGYVDTYVSGVGVNVVPQTAPNLLANRPATQMMRRQVDRLDQDLKEAAPAPRDGTGNIERGRRQIEVGDRYFAEGEYRKAFYRYKDATKTSPGLADAYFRQGQAAIAQGRYEQAVEAFRRGIELNPDWAKSRTRFEALYGNDQGKWQEHLAALAKESEAHPQDASLQFLMGVALYFSGQPLVAEEYFVQAGELGGSQFHMAGFFRAIDARAAARTAVPDGANKSPQLP
jgi:tetratricopeptide (TPR) repeat protein